MDYTIIKLIYTHIREVVIMLDIVKIGENTAHDYTFSVDRPQGHPVYLLLLVKTEARFFIEGSWKHTPAGTAMLFKPGQRHLYAPLIKEEPYTKEFPAYIDDWAHITSTSPLMPGNFLYGYPVVLHNPDDYYNLFHLVNNEFYGVSPHKSQIIESLINTLLLKILDECNVGEFPYLYYKLVAMRGRIYSQPQNNWNMEDMAKSVNISKGYLHSIYKYFFNTTCIADVIQSRIQYACDLLDSTNKTVEETGILCGYNNTEHFIRQFKREMGITPARYRKDSQK